MVVIESAIANLQRNEEFINDLNVFPVPDGDTGSNMLATVMSGFDSIKPTMENDIEIMQAFAKGTLMGARGNSGVITSQIIKGFSDGVKKSGGFSYKTTELKGILSEARRQAYDAVAEPVEGTILTITKAIDEEYNRDSKSITEAFGEIVAIAEKATLNTPNQLEVLKKAGVVDSGAEGLVKLLEGAYLALQGTPLRIRTRSTKDVKESSEVIKADAHLNIGYCTEFIVTLKDPEGFNKADLLIELSKQGDSIAIINDEDILKVHVHTKTPGKALDLGQTLGQFSKIKIDNMSTQVEHNDAETDRKKDINPKQLGIIAVSNGEGINQLFTDFGADEIVFGGQSMNPSVIDMQEAIAKLPNKQILILPNNSNIIMTAEQAAKASDREIFVLPTKSIQQGIIALQNLSKEMVPFTDYNDDLIKTFVNLNEGVTTYAVRDTEMDGVEIKEGQ
jgi:DAK2 domain fusion protein YloV